VLSDTIDAGNVVNVSFRHEYTSPVVVAFINTRNGVESVAPRIKEVTATGCIIFMQEPDHQGHMAETVSYIVAEEGRYKLDDGLIFEAGAIETDKGREKGEIFEGDQITFSQSFQHPPAVLHSLNTHTNEDFTASLATKITSHGFEIAQEYAETGGWNIVEETIAWIAFETGSGATNGNKYIIGMNDDGISNGVDDTAYVIDLSSAGYEVPPDVVVAVNGINGRDGSWARGSGLYNTNTQGVYTEEDQIFDTERAHTSEPFAWAAFRANTDMKLPVPSTDEFGAKHTGFCVKADGQDQNSGVYKIASADFDGPELQRKCLQMCSAYPGHTGCEVIWNQYNRGCYVHTQEVVRGNGIQNHACWINVEFWLREHFHLVNWARNGGWRQGTGNAPLPLRNRVLTIDGYVKWEDQGWGNTSAAIWLYRVEQNGTHHQLKVASMVDHGPLELSFSVQSPGNSGFWGESKEGDLLHLYIDVGGPGSSLRIDSLNIDIQFIQN